MRFHSVVFLTNNSVKAIFLRVNQHPVRTPDPRAHKHVTEVNTTHAAYVIKRINMTSFIITVMTAVAKISHRVGSTPARRPWASVRRRASAESRVHRSGIGSGDDCVGLVSSVGVTGSLAVIFVIIKLEALGVLETLRRESWAGSRDAVKTFQ